MTRLFHAFVLMTTFCGLCSTAALAEPTVPTRTVPPLSSFSEVLERPLFSPDRKRHLKAEPAAMPEKATLTAIILLKEKRYALLREDSSVPRRIQEGDAIGSMRVKKILRDRIIATATDGTESVIRLFADTPADAAGTTATASASQVPPMTAPPAEGAITAGNRPTKPLISSTR